MSIENIEQRILRAKQRAAGLPDEFPMTVTEGSEVETKRPRNDGQVDITVPSRSAPTEQDMRGRIKDDHVMPESTPTEPIKIGEVVLYKTGLSGWERRLTKDGDSDWELHLPGGRIVRNTNEILRELHAEGRRIAASKVK